MTRRFTTTTTWTNLRGCVPLEAELEINFLSSGSHTPASMHGGPDRLGWAEEGDDERLLDSVVLTVAGHKFTLPKEFAEQIFEHFRDHVYDADVERKRIAMIEFSWLAKERAEREMR